MKINNYVSRFSFPPMSLPKIANALEPRVIPEHKMWFNPLAPEPEEEEQPVERASNEDGAESECNGRRTGRGTQAGRGAPLEEAEAIVPKPDRPKVAVIVPEEQPPALTHNL